MKRASDKPLPKIAYVFGDMSGGGHNLQAFKTIYYSGAVNNCIVISLFEGDDRTVESKLREIGLDVIYLRMNKLRLTAAAKELRRVVEENGCAIAHSNGLKSDLMCTLAFRKSSVSHVITLHNYLKADAYLRMSAYKARIAVAVQHRVLRRCRYIIACSETLKRSMLADDPKLHITAIQNGVDISNFVKTDRSALREKNGIAQDKIIFICTGMLYARKRVPETAGAFLKAELSDRYELWFAGSGEHLEEYKERFAKYGSIRVLGKRSDISDLLNTADVFVSSSENEGLPLAVLEAISVGLPVYLSDIPQHKEILDELPGAGRLYSLGDEDGLARLLQETESYLADAQPVSLTGGPFDISVMGDAYREYYNAIR